MSPAPRRRPATLPVLAALVALAAAGCVGGSSGSGTPSPSWTPVPDDELVARVRALPHVTDASIAFRDNITDGIGYRGTVTTDGRENPYEVMDRAYAILRQGRPGTIWVSVTVPTSNGVPRSYDDGPLLGDPTAGRSERLDARYGPQPGDGTPPAGEPVPTPTGWTPVNP